MDDNYILSIVAIVLSVVSAIIGVINHKRLRSQCNGKELVVALDIENTTPNKELKIVVPKIEK
jgi:hypothetical protein